MARLFSQSLFVLALSLASLSCSAQTLVVSGQANIFGAGHTTAPAPGGGGGGILPPVYNFTSASNLVLTFVRVTGQVGCCGSGNSLTGPDGYVYPTDIQAYNGIAGLYDSSRAQFLAGVFLDATEPANSAPARLSFTNHAFMSLSPLIDQPFYVGDGLTGTGTGTVQQFQVPLGATRLYLGIIDGGNTTGLPGSYGDNVGSFTANFSIQAVPEPADALLALVSVVSGSVIVLRHRRHSRHCAAR